MNGKVNVLISLTTILFALVAGVSAFGLPTFIGGQVQNEGYLAGYEVKMTNLRTGEFLTFSTTKSGHFQFDPSKIRFGFRDGDDFEIECEGKSVIIEDVSQGDVIQDIVIDLRGTICPECKPCPPEEPCPECPEDTTPYAECDSCCPADETPYAECDICCEECPPIPEDDDTLSYLMGAGIAAIVGIAGYFGKKKLTKEDEQKLEEEFAKRMSIGSGFRAYKHTDGKVRYKHLHYGIVGYHDIQRIHKNPEYRHEPGRLMV